MTAPQPGSLFGDGFYRGLCENLGVPLIACDAQLHVRMWNHAAARLFGAAEDRMIGTPVVSVFPLERRAVVEAMARDAITNGNPHHLDFDDRDATGKRRELACTFAPILNDATERIGASLCIRDISLRIAVQSEIHHQRKMASLGNLAGAVAHHFNNILGGITTGVDFALGVGSPETAMRVLSQTSKALVRATALLKGLMVFSEGDRRGEDLSDFTEVVNDVADEIERAVATTGITFTLRMPQLPVLPVGRSQLATVLRNLTQNAIEAMPEGGTLTITVAPQADRLLLHVRDTGRGMDEEQLLYLFEPFRTTKGRLTADEGGGAGLGLAIAHGIVQTMGGTINVSSQLGKGSCFTISLPLAVGERRRE